MNRRALLFWGLVAAQVLFLLGWAGYHEWVRQTAPTILLKVRPVDPRDIMRGDYMILGYDVSTAPKPDRGGQVVVPYGSEVFVVLEKRGPFHEVVRTSSEEPQGLKPGQIWVRGTVDRFDDKTIGVNYGIEQYFVPEGMGTPDFKRLEARVSVSPDHRLYIRQLLLDGRPYP
ncbi:MAG TPA: GDYXXLXY domain-containing protein [Thermoanaerobaculia bacterium]|jgi:uncharacterized membrane-anchored protein|nr:GDYXXLXY domain-containing protein [Thermoanaerobaculia bacterium]